MTQLTYNRDKVLRKIQEMSAEKLHFFYIKMLGWNLISEIYRPLGLYETSLKMTAMSEAVSKMAEDATNILFDRFYKDWATSKLHDSHFGWLSQNNHKQVIYTWLLLTSSTSFTSPQLPAAPASNPNARLFLTYSETSLPEAPVSVQECFKYIHLYFQMTEFDEATKVEQVRYLRTMWETREKFRHKLVKKITKNSSEISDWLYGQLAKTNLFNFDKLSYSSFQEKSELLIAVILASEYNELELTALLDRIYNSYSQKKFQEKPADQKGANMWLSSEQIRMLKSISKHKKLSEKDSLSALINDAYLKIID